MPALAVYAITLAVYALTCGAAVGWLDAPELVAAASSLGIPHSPGHPLVVMIGKIATLLPIGDIPFRVALASALAAAGAATAVFYLAQAVLAPILAGKGRQASSSTRAVTGMSMGVAMTAAFSWAMWFQGVRAEVYALEGLLAVGALLFAFTYRRDGKPGQLLVFALLAGLAAANHPAIAATVLVPAVVLVLSRRIQLRRLAMAIAAGVGGLLSLAYLPVRAAADPALNWGDPSTFSRFLWTISGRAFHKTAGAEHTSTFGQDLAQSLVAVTSAATVPLGLLALASIYLVIRERRQRVTAAILWAIVGLAIVGRAVLGFDPETPDHHAYLVPAVVALAVLGAVTIALVASIIERSKVPSALAGASAAVALVLLAGVQLAGNLERSNLASARASDQLIEATVAELPPRALLLSAYFETRFQLHAASEVFGARPDVTILDRSFLTYPGAREHALRRHPELAALINAPLRAGAPSPLSLLDAKLGHRPIVVELHPNVEAALRARLAPLGAFAIYLPDGAARAQVEALDEHAMKRLARTASTDVRFDGERAMLSFIWRDFMRLQLYCEQQRTDAARVTHARLRALVPADRELDALASRCGLGSAAPPGPASDGAERR